MKLNISILKESLQNSFIEIMTNNSYSLKGMKRYRVFIFSFMFGCIHVNELAYIFYEEVQNRQNKSNNELLNTWGTMLNYLSSKKKMLEKLSNGYYTLENAGTRDLYEHLKDKNYIPDIDYETFKRMFRKNKVHVSHSCRTGRSVLSFIQLSKHSFLVEPEFDSLGNLLSNPIRKERERFLSPDALIYSNYYNEKFYIEADSSTEKNNARLIPKFDKYSSSVLKTDNNYNSTIQFIIWNKLEEDNIFLINNHELNNLTSMYDFIINYLRLPISFTNFINILSSYRGEFNLIISMSSILKGIDVSNIYSSEQLLCVLERESLKSTYTKKYLLRRKNILSCIDRNPEFKEFLLKGVRLVCLPLNSYNNLYKYIYLEMFSPEEIAKKIFGKTYPDFRFILFRKIMLFKDNISGDSFYFRNVFSLNCDGKKISISIENVSDDLSGFLRVHNYISFCRNIQSENIIIYCLFNNNVNADSINILRKKSELFKNIKFISYDDFSSII